MYQEYATARKTVFLYGGRQMSNMIMSPVLLIAHKAGMILWSMLLGSSNLSEVSAKPNLNAAEHAT
jgi:hypothetical protein